MKLFSFAWVLGVAGMIVASSRECAAQTTCDPHWLPGPAGTALNGSVYALQRMPNGDMIAAGVFTTAGATTVNYIARWDGVAWRPMGAGMSGTVLALTLTPGGDLIAGGRFASADGTPVNYVARWDGNTWHPMGAGMNSYVMALAVMPNGDVVAGGRFTAAGGTPANRVARWNGSAWSPLGQGFGNNEVDALLVRPNGDLVAAGYFTSAGAVQANKIAYWNGTDWFAYGSGMSGLSANPYVVSLTNLPGGDFAAGGFFSQAGATPAMCIARWHDGAGWLAMGPGINGPVRSLAVLADGQLIAGGDFTSSGWFTLWYITYWTGADWLPLGIGTNERVYSMRTMANGDLMIGGEFSLAGELPCGCWARWAVNASPGVAASPTPQLANAGEAVTLQFTPSPGYSDVSFHWLREGTPISDGPGGASPGGGFVSGASGVLASPTEATPIILTIMGAQASDSGAFRVVLENACGSTESDAAMVTITGGAACDPDYNQDGGPDLSDVFDLAWDVTSGTESFPPNSPDFNKDGSADLSDIFDLASVVSGGACP